MARRNRYYLVRMDASGQPQNSALVSRAMADDMRARWGGTVREYVSGPLKIVRQGSRVFSVPLATTCAGSCGDSHEEQLTEYGACDSCGAWQR